MTRLQYYEVLGIAQASTDQDVKKAYRKQALQWHPDKNPQNRDVADKKFKEIAEAYEVLGDSKKRSIYDRYGEDGLKNGSDVSHSNRFGCGMSRAQFRSPFDVFQEFFGDKDPFEDFFANHTRLFPDFFSHGGSGARDPFGDFFNTSSAIHKPNNFSIFSSQFGRGRGFFEDDFGPQLPDENKKGGSYSSTTFSFSGPMSDAAVTKTSTTTKFVNGKKVVTKKTMEGEKEIVEVVEDGKLKSKTVSSGVIKPEISVTVLQREKPTVAPV